MLQRSAGHVFSGRPWNGRLACTRGPRSFWGAAADLPLHPASGDPSLVTHIRPDSVFARCDSLELNLKDPGRTRANSESTAKPTTSIFEGITSSYVLLFHHLWPPSLRDSIFILFWSR